MAGKAGKLSVEEGASETTGKASGVSTVSTDGRGGKDSVGSLSDGLICGSSVAIGVGAGKLFDSGGGIIPEGFGAISTASVDFAFNIGTKGFSDNCIGEPSERQVASFPCLVPFVYARTYIF
jgi:hypothetical protein